METIGERESIHNFYEVDEGILGKGAFAVVKRGVNKQTGDEVAIKIIERENLQEEEENDIKNEVDILSRMSHPNIVKLHEMFEEPNKKYIVLEFMSGGELFDRIVEAEHYSEKEAANTIKPIIEAINYCHSLGIVHRDLKPENLLYLTPEPDSVIKITDFGLASILSEELATEACGTPEYVAPEVLTGEGYGKEVDNWSIGCIIYILLSGNYPFTQDTKKELFEAIKQGNFDFPSPQWDDISELAKDLIRKLLVVNPSKRMTAEAMLSHPWIIGEETPTELLRGVTMKIREFNAKRKFRKAALKAVAIGKLKNVLQSKGSSKEASPVKKNYWL